MSGLFYLYNKEEDDCRVVACSAILALLLNDGFSMITLEKYNKLKRLQRKKEG